MATENDTSSRPNPPEKEQWLTLLFDDGNKSSIMKPDEVEKLTVDAQPRTEEALFDHIAGSMLGLTVGDALGAHVEFRPHDYLIDHPVTDLTGGGTWGLEKGQFTDDTSMALCLALSLIACRGFNAYDQLVRYKWWYRHGYMSSTGQCFDIGAATRTSIEEFEKRQTGFSKKYGISAKEMDYLSDRELLDKFDVNGSKEGVAGNGSLMRLAPVPLFFFRHPPTAVDFAGRSGQVTHGDQKAIDACRYYAALIVAALHGESKDDLLHDDFYARHQTWFDDKELHVDILNISRGSYKKKEGYEDGIRGSGYVVKSLEAALWSFWSTDNFEAGALAAVNLGDDTDTTAAIYGQLAGACYGWKNLPGKWVDQLYAKKFILKICGWIGYEGDQLGSKFISKNTVNESADAALDSKQSTDASSEKPDIERPTFVRSISTARDYDEYLRWSYDDVSYWLESLNSDFHQYVHSFKRERINGECLLKYINGRILEQLGIHTAEHRAVILHGIEKLKSEVSSDFYKQFHGDDYARIWNVKEMCRNDSRSVSSKIREQMESWIKTLPPTITHDGFAVAPYSAQYRIFLQQILSIDYQCNPNEGFLMTLGAKLFLNDQVKIVTRLRQHKREASHKWFEKVCIVRGWYGCSHDEMSEIVHEGFKYPVKMGPGDNDKGFCFKSSFRAAAEEVGIPGCVIMCYVILRHPFPTIINPKRTTEDHFRYRFYSDGRHSIYQEECPRWTNHQQRHFTDPVAENVNAGLYDEFVTFQRKDILPQVVVYLKPHEVSGGVWNRITNWMTSTTIYD